MDDTPIPSSGMNVYKYQPLDPTKDIRLIKVLPGQPQDKLQIEIHHTVLQATERSPLQRLYISALRKTLPDGWDVHETIDHDYLFRNKATEDTSWNHPSPEIESTLYTPLPEYPDTRFEPSYEALSYT
jgi:hypothetical protein